MSNVTTQKPKPSPLSIYLDQDDLLRAFYEAIYDGDIRAIQRMHVPRSEVYYARTAYEAATGHKITLDRMERAMFLEGMLSASDVLDPERKRDWEQDYEPTTER